MTPDLALSEIESEFSSLLGAPSKNTLTLKKLAGDISTRRYYRVTTHANAFILQQADVFSDPQQNTFLVAQQLLESCGVRVPKIIEVRPKKGWILMEDLGDEMLQTHISQKLYCGTKKTWLK